MLAITNAHGASIRASPWLTRRVRSVRGSVSRSFMMRSFMRAGRMSFSTLPVCGLGRFVAGTGLRPRAGPEVVLRACTEVAPGDSAVGCEGDLAPWVGLDCCVHHRRRSCAQRSG